MNDQNNNQEQQYSPPPASPIYDHSGQSPPGPLAPVKESVNAGLVILQWLTYAFWGWTILALTALTTSVIYSFIDKGSNDFAPYGIAAVLVLLPISFICDFFYAKREPVKKAGVEILVMVIHAVIFALFGIGALICTVVSLVMLFTGDNDNTGTQVFLASAFITTIYYGLVFLRTINLQVISWFSQIYRLVMVITVGIIALLGLFGPVAQQRATRDDRLIDSNISSLTSEIGDYSRANNKLPASLDDLQLRGDTKELVTRNLVTYKPESRVSSNADRALYGQSGAKNYYYQLCATYKEESSDRYRSSYNSYEDAEDGGYSSYISSSDHPKGEKCYKVKTGY